MPGTDALLRWSRRGDRVELELDGADPDRADSDLVEAIASRIRALLDRPESEGVEPVLGAAHPPDRWHPLVEAVAHAIGFAPRRLLLQLRRSLPVPPVHPARQGPSVSVRPIEPGDDQAWLRVNNRAFADHPDQGSETVDTLAARRSEPWYDPAGFLVADDPDRPGELSGFCWTKEHPATNTEPALGEIYVIGVDPSHRGEGLGPAFVLAGLDHLAEQGFTVSNLYVEADNEPALALYDRLGYHVHERRRVYAP